MSYTGKARIPSSNVVPLRTFDPKYSHYFSDGTGRDGYVESNNGGFSVSRPKIIIQGTSYKRFGHSPSGPCSPRVDPMPVEYHSDGSGRDGYIVFNSGGFKQVFSDTCGE